MDDISSDEALLIEYLDGELSQKERQTVEERLAQEPVLRKELVRLEESWQRLDLLERELSDDTLVEATIESVIVKTEESLKAIRIQHKYRRYGRGAVFALLAVLVFLGTVTVGFRFAMNEQQLTAALAVPVIERLDMYLAVAEEEPDFLPLLAQQRVFLPPLPEGEPPVPLSMYHASDTPQIRFWEKIIPIPWSEYSPAKKSFLHLLVSPFNGEYRQRIRRIEGFDESFYSTFYNNYQKFLDYSPERKEKLRQLYKSIKFSPRQSELFQTLYNYYLWRKSLQSYENTELRQPFSAEKQVERIAALKKRLDKSLSQRETTPLVLEVLQVTDIVALSRQLESLSMSSKAQILDAPPNQTLSILKELAQQNETVKPD